MDVIDSGTDNLVSRTTLKIIQDIIYDEYAFRLFNPNDDSTSPPLQNTI